MKALEPSVSVIMPAYNAAAFVGPALTSVRAQTFRDFEVIVVDDGSTDETAAKVREAVADDRRFRLIRQPNGGVAAARNRGLAEARGRYVANLDSDDMWRPTFLKRGVAALEAAGEGAVFAFARSVWIDQHDRLLSQSNICLPEKVGYRELLIRNPVGNGSAMVMRTDAVRRAGGYDEDLVQRYGQTEDWLLLLKLSWQGEVIPLGDPLVLYRVMPTSASHGLERTVRGALEVIRRCQRDGPKLPRSDYWTARSLTLLWLARRAARAGNRAMAARLAVQAYADNPLWFTLPELRRPLARLLTARLGRPPPPSAQIGVMS